MGYHPSVGRLMQRDPAPYADGMNPYQYVSSNPINVVDPAGLTGEAPIVEFTGVNIIRVKKREDMPGGVLGRTHGNVSSMEFTVDIRGGKCCVVIAKADWGIESVRYLDDVTFRDHVAQANWWTWSQYEQAKSKQMSNKEWHDNTNFYSWSSVEAHENAHVAQLSAVGGTALAEYIKRYNAAPELCYDDPHSAMDQANKMNESEFYRKPAEAAIAIAMIQKSGAWGPGEAGEEAAVQAERQALETEYQDYLRNK
jgi:uncharacterized protein RhaS with RHS repeats